MGEFSHEACHNPNGIIPEWSWIAERLSLQPVVVELDAFHVEAVEAERVDVAVPDVGPVDEFDPQLVGRVGFADEIRLVQLEQVVEQIDLRDGGLTDADRPDLFRFDELDGEAGYVAHGL